MEIEQTRERLTAFFRMQFEDDTAEAFGLEVVGSSGGTCFFSIRSGGLLTEYVLKVGEPRLLEQVPRLRALRESTVQHCPVLWSGDDPRLFGGAYVIQPRLNARALDGSYRREFTEDQLRWMARQAMATLASLHRVPVEGEPTAEVTVTSAPDGDARLATLRELLVERAPRSGRVGLTHGRFDWSNLLYADLGDLSAVIGWERCAVGLVGRDSGWMCMVSDVTAGVASGDELAGWYGISSGAAVADDAWFRAEAVYRMLVESGQELPEGVTAAGLVAYARQQLRA